MATRERTGLPGRWKAAEPDHQLPPGRRERSERSERASLSDLVRRLAEDSRLLLKQEIALAKAEAGQTARRVAADSGWIAAGAGVAALGGICLVVALALGLGALLDSYWLGTLITGLVLLLIGAGVAWRGVSDLKDGSLAPTRTVRSLRADADWARTEMRDLKEELKE